MVKEAYLILLSQLFQVFERHFWIPEPGAHLLAIGFQGRCYRGHIDDSALMAEVWDECLAHL